MEGENLRIICLRRWIRKQEISMLGALVKNDSYGKGLIKIGKI